MSDILEKKSGLNDHQIKSRRLVCEVFITGHATPASKKHASDISDSLHLQTEGKNDITAVDALTGLTPATPVDLTGVFNLLLSCENARDVKKVVVTSAAATVVTATVTADKNILLEVNSADDLTVAALNTYLVEIDYVIE